MAAIILMIANQKKTKLLDDRIAALTGDISAKQREAEMLARQLDEAKRDGERLMNDTKRQYDELLAGAKNDGERRLEAARKQYAEQLAEVNERNEREKAERTAMLDRQFAERLKLVQEQLNTTTERLLKQRSEELDMANRNQMGAIIAPLREVMTEMKKSMDDNREVVYAQHGVAKRTAEANARHDRKPRTGSGKTVESPPDGAKDTG